MPAYSQTLDRVESPARNWVAVTPSDSAPLVPTPKALYVGVAGNLSVTGADGVAATFAVAAGSYHPLCAVLVRATGTTATGIVALS